MQNIIWGVLLLAFMIDIFRRSLINNEKATNEKSNNEILNNSQITLDKISNAGKIKKFNLLKN